MQVTLLVISSSYSKSLSEIPTGPERWYMGWADGQVVLGSLREILGRKNLVGKWGEGRGHLTVLFLQNRLLQLS